MRAHRMEVTIPSDGELKLKALPFQPGETVEIIILPLEKAAIKVSHFPLSGTVLKYTDATKPVAEDDWDVLQ